MEKYEYEKMFLFEQNYWWYKGLRLFLKQNLEKISRNKKRVNILDAGCGTGGNLELLKDLGCKKIFGFDMEPKAVNFCHKRGFNNIVIGNLNKIPFKDNKFDIILCINVLECREVNEKVAYKELLRVLKPGGYLFFVLAAFQFLLSEHDYAVHLVRRYSKRKALRKFSTDKANIKKMTYYFFLLFPFLVTFKIFKKIFRDKKLPQSDLIKIPRWLNEFLYFIVFIEEKLSRIISFPFGTSLFVLIQKSSNNIKKS